MAALLSGPRHPRRASDSILPVIPLSGLITRAEGEMSLFINTREPSFIWPSVKEQINARGMRPRRRRAAFTFESRASLSPSARKMAQGCSIMKKTSPVWGALAVGECFYSCSS